MDIKQHGHSRNADYYLKRALVEKESFIKIFSETNEKEDPAIVESRIYYSACVVAEYLARLEAIECCKETSVSSFIKDAVQLFDAVIENKKNLTVFNGILHHQAPLLEEIILLCAYDLKKHPSNTDLAYSIRFYLDNLAEYLAHYNITTLENLAEEISQCMCKQFALYVGTELVKLEKEATWNDKIQELIKGV